MTLVTSLPIGNLLSSVETGGRWGELTEEPVLGRQCEVWTARLQRGRELWAGARQISFESHVLSLPLLLAAVVGP